VASSAPPEARLEDAGDMVRRIAIRYLASATAQPMRTATARTTPLIRLEPGHVRAWDFADQL
jgi:hypothetical protein